MDWGEPSRGGGWTRQLGARRCVNGIKRKLYTTLDLEEEYDGESLWKASRMYDVSGTILSFYSYRTAFMNDKLSCYKEECKAKMCHVFMVVFIGGVLSEVRRLETGLVTEVGVAHVW